MGNDHNPTILYVGVCRSDTTGISGYLAIPLAISCRCHRAACQAASAAAPLSAQVNTRTNSLVNSQGIGDLSQALVPGG